MKNLLENPRKLLIVDLLLVVPFLILPLLITLPYRVNIFLSWEGAYRLYLGQIPFRDFGLPMGYGYWLLPAVFFKWFGPTMLSLVKAQVLINLVSFASLRGILYNLKVKPVAITLILLVFSLTYILYNFWPWYNHSVVVFELVALYFVTTYSADKTRLKNNVNISLAGVFTFLSFFTKQDVGAICFVLCLFLIAYYAITERKIEPVITYLISFVVVGAMFIIPVFNYGFSYWFNLGQAPHSSRISSGLLLQIFFSHALVEKIYLLLLFVALLVRFSSWRSFLQDRLAFSGSIITVALILQSLVTRATSPLPTDHMNYYHTFALAGIALLLPWERLKVSLPTAFGALVLIVLIFSEGYWKYIGGFFTKAEIAAAPAETPWVTTTLPTLKRISMPAGTAEGIERLRKLPILQKSNLKVLNMTELTSLAYELNYTPLPDQPLWYHLHIGMFEKEVDEFVRKIDSEYYDLVLFESVPSLTEFYPYAVRNKLLEKYTRVDSFAAPRKIEDSTIEVFIRANLH
ncbi:MAG: hypothetical protein KF775_01645 [Cyclobacteriaceae bacterium]|nr:hypothetical protein [Cyclobacteriaceae bacterium]